MQSTLLQKYILYTMATLCHAVAAGCQPTASNNPTTTVVAKPPEKPTPQKIDPDKDENKAEKEDEDIEKQIEAELVAEQQSLEKIKSFLEKYMEAVGEGERTVHPNWTPDSPYDHRYRVEPSAPEFPYDLPPPYNPNWEHDPTNFPGNDTTLYPDLKTEYKDPNLILERLLNGYYSPKAKLQVIEFSLKAIEKMKSKLRTLIPLPIDTIKENLRKSEEKESNLRQKLKEICSNKTLSDKEKQKDIDQTYLKIRQKEVKIKYLKTTIQKKEKNNKSDKSTNDRTKPYPTQKYVFASTRPL